MTIKPKKTTIKDLERWHADLLALTGHGLNEGKSVLTNTALTEGVGDCIAEMENHSNSLLALNGTTSRIIGGGCLLKGQTMDLTELTAAVKAMQLETSKQKNILRLCVAVMTIYLFIQVVI